MCQCTALNVCLNRPQVYITLMFNANVKTCEAACDEQSKSLQVKPFVCIATAFVILYVLCGACET